MEDMALMSRQELKLVINEYFNDIKAKDSLLALFLMNPIFANWMTYNLTNGKLVLKQFNKSNAKKSAYFEKDANDVITVKLNLQIPQKDIQNDFFLLKAKDFKSKEEREAFLKAFIMVPNRELIDYLSSVEKLNRLNERLKSSLSQRLKDLRRNEKEHAKILNEILQESNEIYMKLDNFKGVPLSLMKLLHSNKIIKSFNLTDENLKIDFNKVSMVNHNENSLERIRKTIKRHDNLKILFDVAMDPSNDAVKYVISPFSLRIDLNEFFSNRGTHISDIITYGCRNENKFEGAQHPSLHRHFNLSCYGSYITDLSKLVADKDIVGFINTLLVFTQSLNWLEFGNTLRFERTNMDEGAFEYKGIQYTPQQIGDLAIENKLDFLIQEEEEEIELPGLDIKDEEAVIAEIEEVI